MARSRLIKPNFFLNEVLGHLTPLCRILFAGLWTLADSSGRLQDRPNQIKVQLLPYDRCDVDKMLTALSENGFISRYSIRNEKYIQIVNFDKHQHVHPKEAKSEIPPPESVGNSGTSPGNSGTSRVNSPFPSLSSFPSSPSLPSGSSLGKPGKPGQTSRNKTARTPELESALEIIRLKWRIKGNGYEPGERELAYLASLIGNYGPPKAFAIIELFPQTCDDWTRKHIGMNVRGLEHQLARILDDDRLKTIERKYETQCQPISIKIKSSAEA